MDQRWGGQDGVRLARTHAARDLTHRRHNPLVERSLSNQATHISCCGGNFREHLATQDSVPRALGITVENQTAAIISTIARHTNTAVNLYPVSILGSQE
jgi:hypothetical protein